MQYGIKQIQQGAWNTALLTVRGYEVWLGNQSGSGYPKNKTPTNDTLLFDNINEAYRYKLKHKDHDNGECYFVVDEVV